MSVDNTPTGIVYTVTNGAAGQQYPLTFPYIKDDDVRAYYVHGGTQVTMSLGSGYSVSGQTFTASIALPVGAKLAIYRETDITQEILWVDGQAVYTPDIMQADDKLTFIVQEIAGEVKRAVKVSREEEAGGSTPEALLKSIYTARDDAANAAVNSEGSAQRSAAQADRSQFEADRAESEADRANTEANRSKVEADRAESAAEVAADDAHAAVAVEVDRATAQADRAKDEADRAQSLSNIGPATVDKLGFVKIGDGIAVEADGTISVTPVDFASSEKPGTVKPGLGLTIADGGALNVSCWDAFPPYVPIPVWGVTFGGSDGRRAIMPGEATARENWMVCDGGSDDKGGTLPNLKGRVFLGADASHNAGTLGGSASHSHTVSGSVDATTISTAQMPSHGHAYTSTNNQNSQGVRGEATYINNGVNGATTGAQGGSAGHAHSFSATSSATASYMPYCAINFVMKVA
ncbi:MAG: hypothetical protein RBR41_03080 [Desulfovibrio sp.]|uniref:hypothetical protein n=1 Tax=Desulfovibrio sp. TaxID=885 RepID=UPI002A35F016|nr:hypothetical protein [Desulfovibrio sp.]MDY0258634.1 hypothetical protein [Desulfovibrio sp.]